MQVFSGRRQRALILSRLSRMVRTGKRVEIIECLLPYVSGVANYLKSKREPLHTKTRAGEYVKNQPLKRLDNVRASSLYSMNSGHRLCLARTRPKKRLDTEHPCPVTPLSLSSRILQQERGGASVSVGFLTRPLITYRPRHRRSLKATPLVSTRPTCSYEKHAGCKKVCR